jgi:replicative DNA helicase
MVDIRDRTKGLILPIHHMTKDMDHEDRLKYGFRPLLRHLKGSTRIQDFANKVILIHRPGFYNDFVTLEEAKGMIKLSNGKFQRGTVIRKLFIIDLALNRGGKVGVVRFLHKLQYCQFKEWK